MIPHPGAAQATGSPGAGPATSRILVAGGEPKIRSLIGGALAAAGYATDLASTRTEGLRRALECHYDLIILDLGTPDLDGRDVLERMLSARPGQAVMVLSGRADVAARVDCLERGAQDYLVKPFSLAELLARVRLRVRDSAHPRGEVIKAGQLRLDLGRLSADTGHGPVPLTRLEFLLLRELAGHAGQPVPKGKLLATVWGYDFDPGSNVVDVCVRRLRSKLGFDLIKTVRGEGYRLAGQLPARPHGKPPAARRPTTSCTRSATRTSNARTPPPRHSARRVRGPGCSASSTSAASATTRRPCRRTCAARPCRRTCAAAARSRNCSQRPVSR